MPIPAPFTDQQIADQLTIDGSHWFGDNGDGTINYSFSASFGVYTASNGNEYGLDNVQESWIRLVLGQLSELFDFNFVEMAEPVNTWPNAPIDYIQFGNHPSGGGTFSNSWTYNANPSQIAFSNIYFDDGWDSNQSANLSYGSYGYMTMVHEILHSLGLSHPGAYNGSGSYQTDAEFEQDTHRYTVMSYFNSYEDGSGSVYYDAATDTFVFPRTPMVYDILAMTQGDFNGQFGGYGFNTTTRNTDTTYGYNASAGINAAYDFGAHGAPVLTIYDTGGIDTLDLSGDLIATKTSVIYDANGVALSISSSARTDTLIDIREGGYSSTHGMTYNIGIAFGTVIENVIGTIYNDTIWGNDANNDLQGQSGDDIIHGGVGDDSLDGGANSDTLYGENDNDNLNGSTGGDFLFGGDGDDELVGGAGADLLDGGTNTDTASYSNSNAAVSVNLETGVTSGGHAVGDTFVSIENLFGSIYDDILIGDTNANIISGSIGDDNLQGRGGDDILYGGVGSDSLHGGTSNDYIYGEADNDYLNGSNGDDFLYGGDGDDNLIGGAGADLLDGGTNTDTASYSNSNAAVSVNLGTGVTSGGHAVGDIFVSIENLLGSKFDDILTGDASANEINGFVGDDTLEGGDGDDTLLGGLGNDILLGDNGADFLNGGTGIDTADYSGSFEAVTVQLNNGGTISGGYAEGDTVWTENIIGSAFNDFLNGNSLNNTVSGGDGDDLINTSNNNDILNGNGGNDILIGGNGADVHNGGADIDVASYVNSNLAVTVNLGTNTATGGYSTGDTFFDIENLLGSKLGDNLTGDANANSINGYLGDDFLFGGAGDDVLLGSSGNDRLDGGADDDILSGGSGIDYFVFSDALFGHDTITDFTNGLEFLDFSTSGLTFSDLTITSNGNDTIITLASDPLNYIELLGVTGVIDEFDFV